MEERNVSMVILAGGKSSRMGRDKATLMLRGRTFLEWQLEKGKQLGIKEILVSGYHGTDCPVRNIPDQNAFQGPLGGMETCFRLAKYPQVLVLGIDLPLIPENDLKALLMKAAQSEKKAVLLKHGSRVEPLIAVYHRELADEMHRELTEGKGSVFGALKRVGYDVYETKSPDEYFENINYETDYQKLLER